MLVLCGPGNNGGDGFVVARRLLPPAGRSGWPPWSGASAEGRRRLGGGRLGGAGRGADAGGLDGAGLVVDALFGAGLDRAARGAGAGRGRARWAAAGRPVVAVDVPSGVHGGTGAISGRRRGAALTVTFCRLKPGHLLLPARLRMGEIVLADIGIPDAVVHGQRRGPAGEHAGLVAAPVSRGPEDHKYTFGHALVVGGPAAATGASRLAARAALRVGAGLVSVACEPEDVAAYAVHLTAVMTKPVAGAEALAGLLGGRAAERGPDRPGRRGGRGDARQGAGGARPPGAGRCWTRTRSRASPTGAGELLGALHDRCVLTPHEGEFRRLFPVEGDRLGRARAAAREPRRRRSAQGRRHCRGGP